MTISEENVANFFTRQGFSIDRIPVSTSKTPDYWIAHTNFRAVVEVKEIEENDLEKNARREVEASGYVFGVESRDDSKVLRNLIKETNRQLKKLCIGGEPGILVIQDVRPFWTLNIFIEESLKQAMFGDRIIWRSAPNPRTTVPVRTISDNFGGNRTNTDQKNRSVSAVGILYWHTDPDKTSLSVYHNPFAHHALALPTDLSGRVRQFVISSTDQYGHFLENAP